MIELMLSQADTMTGPLNLLSGFLIFEYFTAVDIDSAGKGRARNT
jgi:hypothetical protein